MVKIKTFPLKLDPALDDEINSFVFHTKAKSKQKYIIDAVREKMERDAVILDAAHKGGSIVT